MATAELSGRARDLLDSLAQELGGDDRRVYVQSLLALANVAGDIALAPDDRRVDSAMEHLARGGTAKRAAAARRGLRAAAPVAATSPVEETLYSDPVFLENAAYLVRDRRRIVGGVPTADFPDCVAVGTGQQWCCSGTLVARNVVVTAAHCEAVGCCERVLIGDDTSPAAGARVVNVVEVHVHPNYVPQGASDLAALVLEEDIDDVPPRAIAPSEVVEHSRTLRLVGFGNVDPWASHGYGVKRVVDVPIASSAPGFGADPALELVAGSAFLDRDSCTGDSGGPAYAEHDGGWLLAGATSRATASGVRPCGDGGIYERMSAFESWLRAVPEAHRDA